MAEYKNRLLILSLGPIGVMVLYFLGQGALRAAPEHLRDLVIAARQWLGIFGLLYIVNFILAWVYQESWTATLIRSLVAGMFAYIAVSQMVDLVAECYPFIQQVLGGEGAQPLNVLQPYRYSLICWMFSLVLAVVCIGVGFELPESE